MLGAKIGARFVIRHRYEGSRHEDSLLQSCYLDFAELTIAVMPVRSAAGSVGHASISRRRSASSAGIWRSLLLLLLVSESARSQPVADSTLAESCSGL